MGNEDQTRVVEPASSPPELWAAVQDLSCRLSVALKVPGFTIRDLLSLGVDSVVDTGRPEGAHVPVVVNGVMVGWAEFDVIEGRLAVRLTELV
ncbi:MAG: FliM/FliN family flagellar motor switch protein [Terriglobia bacterium]|jgi:flagellar motor switch protein FliN/FliY